MEIKAPSRWRCIDFISDLHLHSSDPLTFQAWKSYLNSSAADAIFILGDLFEVWVGDDVLTQAGGFEQQCVEVLRMAAQRRSLYIMRGNRDFLMGSALAAACDSTLLDDPSVLAFASQRWLLTHGDALCFDDTEYQQFRSLVRSVDWQRDFLDQPLAQRMERARTMRAQSEARKRSDQNYCDVDHQAARSLLQTHGAGHMIHGHTHRPAKHNLGDGQERLVLSDWELGAQPPRAELLRLRLPAPGKRQSMTVERIPPSMAFAA